MFAFQKGIKKPLGLHLLWAVSHVIYYFLSEKLLLRMFTLNKTLQYLVESKILLSSYELQGRAAVEILLVWTLIFTLNAYCETQQLLWIQGDASLQKAPTGSGSIHQLLSHMEVLQGSSMVHDNIRLINIPKWGKQSVCYRSELLCRGTWKGLEKGACDVQGWSTGHAGEVGDCGLVQPGKDERKERSLCCLQLPVGKEQRQWSQTLPSGERQQDEMQPMRFGTWEIPIRY